MSKRKSSNLEDGHDAKIRKLDCEEKQYLFKPVVSLIDLAACKIAAALWRHQDVRSLYRLPTATDYLIASRITNYDADSESFVHLELRTSRYLPSAPAYQLVNPGYPDSNQDGERVSIEKFVNKLPLPTKLRTLITDRLLPSSDQFRNWIVYHDHRIFFPPEVHQNLASDQLDGLIFKSDNCIDYLATAKNLLLSRRISDLHKYRIMCTYCMEDEIKRASDWAVSIKYLDRVQFEAHPLIYYWNCYLKNELNKIDFKDAPSLASYMIGKVDNWAAIEYFFDQLDCDDQVVKAVTLIHTQGFKYQSAVLLKLSNSQRQRVFTGCAAAIIANSIPVSYCRIFTLSVWNQYKNIITETEFINMISSVCGDGFSSAKDRRNIASLVKEIWTTAPLELINSAAQIVLGMFALHFKHSFVHFSDDEILELFTLILANASPAIKAWFLLQKYLEHYVFLQELVKNHKTYHLDDFLKAVFSDADAIYKRKLGLMKSETIVKHCIGLIQTGNVDQLNDLMTAHLSDTDASEYKSRLLESHDTKKFFIQQLKLGNSGNVKKFVDDETIRPANLDVTDYKLKLLQSSLVTEFCVFEICAGRCKTLYEFINDVLPDSKAAGDFLFQLCTNEKTITCFRQEINEGRFDLVRNAVDQLIAREEDRNVCKLSLFTAYEEMLVNGRFHLLQKVQWDKFIPWCSNDLSKFKKSLPIDDIFLEMLTKSVMIKFDPQLRNCVFRDQWSFEKLDKFLRWYFDSEDEMIEYKMEKVANFRNINLFAMLLEKTEKYCLRSVLNWFFGKNVELIEKFKKLNSKHEICYFL